MKDRLEELAEKIKEIDISGGSNKLDVVQCLDLIHEELEYLREETDKLSRRD